MRDRASLNVGHPQGVALLLPTPPARSISLPHSAHWKPKSTPAQGMRKTLLAQPEPAPRAQHHLLRISPTVARGTAVFPDTDCSLTARTAGIRALDVTEP